MSRFYESGAGMLQEQIERAVENAPMLEKNPLVEKPKPPQVAQIVRRTNSFSEIIYEFRAARQELEESMERLERLGRIGMMVSKMRARTASARPSDDDEQ